MKKNLLVIAFISLASSLSAQSISLIDPQHEVFGFANSSIMEAAFDVKNESSSSINVIIIREGISLISGTDNNICWGPTCYPPTVDTTTSVFIPAEGTNNSFKGDYYPNGNVGTSVIKYCFVNDADHSDSVCIQISYIAEPASLFGNANPTASLNVFPNPSNQQVNFSFGQPVMGSIEIVDISGSSVFKADLQGEEKFILPKGSLSDGIYFCRLSSGDKSFEVKKLIIKN
jgi:hypothetical protein